jgi:WD40 repeat protein
MKKNIICLSLFFILTQQITVAMEQQKKAISIDNFDTFWDKEDSQTEELHTINRSLQPAETAATTNSTIAHALIDENTTIDLIDKEINEKYPTSKSLFNIFSTPLTEHDFLDIITIVDKLVNPLTDHLSYYDLREKNKRCDEAFQYFIALAYKNIENVTFDTLSTILCASEKQSIAQLNLLPLRIKEVIMTEARRNIKHPYDIVLSGHTDAITCFDIYSYTNQVATSSKDETLRLWDLKTGKLIHDFSENTQYAHCIAFNSDGSRLLTATNCIDKYCRLRVWETVSGKLLRTELVSTDIYLLNRGEKNIFIACNYAPYQPRLSVISIDNDTITMLASTILPYKTNFHDIPQRWDYYEAQKTRSNTLTVTKKNSIPLYICQQAIKNTDRASEQLSKLTENLAFSILTEYEEGIVMKALTNKEKQQTHKLLTNK